MFCFHQGSGAREVRLAGKSRQLMVHSYESVFISRVFLFCILKL